MLSTLPNGRQLLTNFASLLSSMGLARLATAAAWILVARQVGPGSYGQFVACFALARLTAVSFSWGLDGWLLWKGGDSPDRATLARNSGAALTWKVGLGVLWMGLLSGLAGWFNPEVFPHNLLLISGLIVWFEELTNTAWSVFKSTLQNDITFRVVTLVQLALVLWTALLVLYDNRQLDSYLWVRVAVAGAGCLWAWSILWQRFGLRIERAALLPTLMAATPFAGSAFLAIVNERADIAIIGQLLGQEQAGLYAPASTLISSLLLIPASAYAVMVPVLVRARRQQNTDQVQRLWRLLLAASSLLGFLLAAGLALSAPWLVALLYGATFASAAPILAILALVLGLRCVTFALAAALVAGGHQKQRLQAQFWAAATNVVANLFVARIWGITGVAWVYVTTEAILLAGYGWAWHRQKQRS